MIPKIGKPVIIKSVKIQKEKEIKKSIMDNRFISFCKEINNLREAVKCWEKKYKTERRQNNKEIHKKFASTFVLALVVYLS